MYTSIAPKGHPSSRTQLHNLKVRTQLIGQGHILVSIFSLHEHGNKLSIFSFSQQACLVSIIILSLYKETGQKRSKYYSPKAPQLLDPAPDLSTSKPLGFLTKTTVLCLPCHWLTSRWTNNNQTHWKYYLKSGANVDDSLKITPVKRFLWFQMC